MTADYVYVGSSAHDNTTFVDVGEARVELEPVAHAQRLLDEHRSVDRIEVWRADERVAVVTRGVAS